MIPTDLVVLPSIDLLDDVECETVDKANWYDAGGVLLASARELQGLSEVDPLDAGINLETVSVLPVGRALHRYSREDGFYHA